MPDPESPSNAPISTGDAFACAHCGRVWPSTDYFDAKGRCPACGPHRGKVPPTLDEAAFPPVRPTARTHYGFLEGVSTILLLLAFLAGAVGLYQVMMAAETDNSGVVLLALLLTTIQVVVLVGLSMVIRLAIETRHMVEDRLR